MSDPPKPSSEFTTDGMVRTSSSMWSVCHEEESLLRSNTRLKPPSSSSASSSLSIQPPDGEEHIALNIPTADFKDVEFTHASLHDDDNDDNNDQKPSEDDDSKQAVERKQGKKRKKRKRKWQRRKVLWWRIPTRTQVKYRLYAFALFGVTVAVWSIAVFFMLGPELMLPPKGPVFALGLLYLVSGIVGYIAHKLLPFLPPLFGMLAAGVFLRNVHPSVLWALQTDEMKEWTSTVRMMALSIILILAGLSVEFSNIIKKGLPTFLLSVMPNLTEAVAVGLASKILLEIPWVWAFLLGFIVCPLSPAVVAPTVRHLEELGYGVNKHIPAMILAAASFDNITVLSGFGVFFSIIFDGSGSVLLKLFYGPMEIVVGMICGILCGLLLTMAKYTRSDGARTLLAVGFSTSMVYGGIYFGKRGAGTLSALLTMTVITETWPVKKRNAVLRRVAKLWIFAQPVLVGTVGASVDLSVMDWRIAFIAFAILSIGLTVRFAVSFLCVCFDKSLNFMERFYVAICWMPKAALQVVLSAIVLYTTQQQGQGFENENLIAEKFVTIAILSVLITAPLGSFLTHVLGKVFLSKRKRKKKKNRKRRRKKKKQIPKQEIQSDQAVSHIVK